MTDPIKAKIQELCPDVMFAASPAKWIITLAVVLRATEKSWATMYAAGGGLIDGRPPREVLPEGLRLYQIVRKWNLEKDSWDSQSAETQAFVGSLLGL